MNTWTKRILTVSAAAAGIGLVLMGVGMGMGGRPGVVFSKNGISSSYQKAAPYLQEKTAIDTFSGINLDIRSEASIQILPSGDNKYYVEYLLDGEAAEPICKVKDDTLTLSQAYSDANVIGVFGIALDDSDSVNPYISIYVPKDVKLKAIDIYNDYGNVAIEDRSMEHAESPSRLRRRFLKQCLCGRFKLHIERRRFQRRYLQNNKSHLCFHIRLRCISELRLRRRRTANGIWRSAM